MIARRHRFFMTCLSVLLVAPALLAAWSAGATAADTETGEEGRRPSVVQTEKIDAAGERLGAGIAFAFPSQTVYLAGDDQRQVTLNMIAGTKGQAPPTA